jgi:hypothetical protein
MLSIIEKKKSDFDYKSLDSFKYLAGDKPSHLNKKDKNSRELFLNKTVLHNKTLLQNEMYKEYFKSEYKLELEKKEYNNMKYYPSASKEWSTSIYSYYKPYVKALIAIDEIVNKLFKSYFNLLEDIIKYLNNIFINL